MTRTLIDVEQCHYMQRDVVSSFHEKLSKGENIVCNLPDTPRGQDWLSDWIRNTWSPSLKGA